MIPYPPAGDKMIKPGTKKKPDKLPEVYINLQKQFDKAFCAQFERMANNFSKSIEKTEQKLVKCERKMMDFIHQTRGIAHADLTLAESLVNKELRFKIIMAQWTNKFLVHSDSRQLDALTWALARYSMNICLCWNEVSPKHFIEAGVHKALAGFIKFKSELVVGPAMMALVHISMHPELKPNIVLAEVLPTIVKLLVTNDSKPILCQACKLLASLALHFPNKSLISNSGNLHGLLDLILGNDKEIDDAVSYAALMGVVNAIQGSDANRMLIVDLDGLKPLLSTLQHTCNNDLILQALRALTNITFCNVFTASVYLSQGGDRVVIDLLQSGNILKDPVIVHAALASVANVCYNEATQSHIGSSLGWVELAIRICDHAREPYVAGEAAMLLLAMMWKNMGNKARVNGTGGCQTLLKRIIRHCPLHDDDNLKCIEQVCYALTSLLLIVPAQERFLVHGGLEEMIRICRQYSDQRLIAAVSAVIVCLVPSPDELLVSNP